VPLTFADEADPFDYHEDQDPIRRRKPRTKGSRHPQPVPLFAQLQRTSGSGTLFGTQAPFGDNSDSFGSMDKASSPPRTLYGTQAPVGDNSASFSSMDTLSTSGYGHAVRKESQSRFSGRHTPDNGRLLEGSQPSQHPEVQPKSPALLRHPSLTAPESNSETLSPKPKPFVPPKTSRLSPATAIPTYNVSRKRTLDRNSNSGPSGTVTSDRFKPGVAPATNPGPAPVKTLPSNGSGRSATIPPTPSSSNGISIAADLPESLQSPYSKKRYPLVFPVEDLAAYPLYVEDLVAFADAEDGFLYWSVFADRAPCLLPYARLHPNTQREMDDIKSGGQPKFLRYQRRLQARLAP
jgi:hypothetical protein